MPKLQDELDEMEKALEEPSAGVDDQKTDPPPTSAPKTAAPGTKAPGTESPKTDSPKTDAPHTEAPKEDPRDIEIRELRTKLAEKETKSSPKTRAPKTAPPRTEPPISDEDFLEGADLDDLTRDPTLFNKLLNKVYKKGLSIGRVEQKRSSEVIIKSVPDIVKNSVAIQARLKKVHDQFYEDNNDLVPWKKSVGTVFEELISENPDKTYEELLPRVATITRERLGLQKSAQKSTDKSTTPSLPRKKGGPRQTTKPDTTPFQQELDEMDKALGLD